MGPPPGDPDPGACGGLVLSSDMQRAVHREAAAAGLLCKTALSSWLALQLSAQQSACSYAMLPSRMATLLGAIVLIQWLYRQTLYVLPSAKWSS